MPILNPLTCLKKSLIYGFCDFSTEQCVNRVLVKSSVWALKNLHKLPRLIYFLQSSLGTISSNGTLSSKISAVAISAICIFCIMFYSGLNNTSEGISLSNSSKTNDTDQVANADSLDTDNE